MTNMLLLKNGFISDGNDCVKADLLLKGRKIVATGQPGQFDSDNYIDCSGLTIMPGFVDPHVHFKLDVGNYTSLDDFSTGTEAALSGGVTSVIDFTPPVNRYSEIPKAIKDRKEVAKKSRIDYSLHLTLAGNPDFSPEKIIELAVHEGLTSIKVFTAYEESNRRTDDGYLNKLIELSNKSGVVIMIHAENDEIIKHNMISAKHYLPEDLPVLRNTQSEMLSAVKIAAMATKFKGQCYIVHISSGETAEFIASHYGETLNKYLFLETCPQYFALNNEVLSKDKGFLFTCCPPLRTEDERKKLLNELRNGIIHSVGTDHCPFRIEEKKKHKDDIRKIPFGIGSLGFTYTLFRTYVSKSTREAVNKLSRTPAKLMGLYPQKGSLLPGTDADIVIVDPEKEWIIDKLQYGRSEYSPYEGLKLKGKVKYTISKGKIVYDGSKVIAEEGFGNFIKRDRIFWR